MKKHKEMAFAVMGATSFLRENADLVMFVIGGGTFIVGYAVAMRITPPPNDNLNYLLGPGKYIDIATGKSNQTQLDVAGNHASSFDTAVDAVAALGRHVPSLAVDPKDNGLKYFINGKYYTAAEVSEDIRTHQIPDAWGTDIDLAGLQAEISKSHVDAQGTPIINPANIPTTVNVNAFNNLDKQKNTGNKSYIMSNGSKVFAADRPELIAQAYPGRSLESLNDDDIKHIYNQIYVGFADRRKTSEGDATRLDVVKWVNLSHNNPAGLTKYETGLIQSNQKLHSQADRGKFNNRAGVQNQKAANAAAAANASTPQRSVSVSNRR